MTSFKSPELHICGRILSVSDLSKPEQSSFYIKANFCEGEDWKLLSGNTKFQTFESQANYGVAPIEQPFNIHYESHNIRGWPRLLLEVWKVDRHGRHNLYGYGTVAVPMATGEYNLDICCWRPMGTWYNRFIGANSELQYPGVIASSLNRYGLRTFSSCIVKVQVNVIGRNFHLHGVIKESAKK